MTATAVLSAAATQAVREMESALAASGAATDWNSATPDQLWITWGKTAVYDTRIIVNPATGAPILISGTSASRANTRLAMAGIVGREPFNRLLGHIQGGHVAVPHPGGSYVVAHPDAADALRRDLWA